MSKRSQATATSLCEFRVGDRVRFDHEAAMREPLPSYVSPGDYLGLSDITKFQRGYVMDPPWSIVLNDGRRVRVVAVLWSVPPPRTNTQVAYVCADHLVYDDEETS